MVAFDLVPMRMAPPITPPITKGHLLSIGPDQKAFISVCNREREAGVYGTNAYFVATVAFDLVPMRVAPPAFFAALSYWAIGLHAGCATCVLAFLGMYLSMTLASVPPTLPLVHT